MKKIICSIVLMMFIKSANAALVSVSTDQASYNAFEPAFVELSLNDLNPETSSLFFDLTFDDASLVYFDFVFTPEVINDTFFTDAFALDNDTLSFAIDFLPDWQNSLTSTFSLGTIEFFVLQDAVISLDEEFVLATNSAGDLIDAQIVNVTSPNILILSFTTWLIVLLAAKRR